MFICDFRPGPLFQARQRLESFYKTWFAHFDPQNLRTTTGTTKVLITKIVVLEKIYKKVHLYFFRRTHI